MTNPSSAEELVERVAIAIRDVSQGEGFDYMDFCRDAARAALEALDHQRLQREIGWQPIESAPTDRAFLAAIWHGKCYVVCQARRTIAGVFDTMEESCVGWRPHPSYRPAFWMPLPEPHAR